MVRYFCICWGFNLLFILVTMFYVPAYHYAECDWDGGDCCGDDRVDCPEYETCGCSEDHRNMSTTPQSIPTSSKLPTTFNDMSTTEYEYTSATEELIEEEYDYDSEQGSGTISEEDQEGSGDKTKDIVHKSDLNLKDEEKSESEDDSASKDSEYNDSRSYSESSESKELESDGSDQEKDSKSAGSMFKSDEITAEIKDKKAKKPPLNSEKSPTKH